MSTNYEQFKPFYILVLTAILARKRVRKKKSVSGPQESEKRRKLGQVSPRFKGEKHSRIKKNGQISVGYSRQFRRPFPSRDDSDATESFSIVMISTRIKSTTKGKQTNGETVRRRERALRRRKDRVSVFCS